ncbi:glycosyltransferase family 9 protein [Mucilaginibacter angelicae]|uniref:Glycosyltransferase family 9 protein n=1 Tax=Mucilaginibacter angelicae TaxID=869718 RepID=A0ABV6LA77_9SPHI
MKKTIHIKLWGGLGDVVLSTPIFKELQSRFPEHQIAVIFANKDFEEVLKYNPYIHKFLIINRFNGWYYGFLERMKIISPKNIAYGLVRPSFTYEIAASKIVAEMIGIELEHSNVQLFTTDEEDTFAKSQLSKYVNPVIINITSVSSANQMWPIEYWRELVSTTPGHTFIQLGVKNETLVEGAIDLRGQTSIRESIALVKHAYFFIGVVSFLSHVTNAFGTPGIVFFGPSAPAVWGHANNINISKNLTCSPCIDFLGKGACPYDKLCMRSITVDEVRDFLLAKSMKRGEIIFQ